MNQLQWLHKFLFQLHQSIWIDAVETKIYVAIEADSKESYFCTYQKNKDELTPTANESVIEMDELTVLVNKEDCYFAGTGWPRPACSSKITIFFVY